MAAEKNNKTLNVPTLRFPEFSGEWERFRNCTLFKVISEKNKNYEFSTVLSASQTEGMVLRDSLGIDIKFEEDSIKTYKIVRNGDYVAHLRSFQGGFAFSDKTGVCSPAYTILRPSETISYGFLKPYFMSRKFIDSLRIVTYGIRDGKSISVEEWLKLYTCIPKANEQEKISKFLKLINERIETQKKVIEDLKKLKYAISQRLFENHTHSDFVSLGMVADIYQPRTIPTSWLKDTLPYPVYGANGLIGKYSEYNHENSQICVACRGNTCGIVNYSEPKSWITGNAMVINTDRFDINKRFLFHQLCIANFSSLISGSGQPQIVRTPLEKMKIWLPDESVQKRIATLLDALNDRVLIKESVLGLIEKAKQYLLFQIFI